MKARIIIAVLAIFLLSGCATTGEAPKPIKLTPEQKAVLKDISAKASIIGIRMAAREAGKRLSQRLSSPELQAAIGICNDALNIENDLSMYAQYAVNKVNASDDKYLKQDVEDLLSLLDLGTDLIASGVPESKEPFIRAAFMGFKQGLESGK